MKYRKITDISLVTETISIGLYRKNRYLKCRYNNTDIPISAIINDIFDISTDPPLPTRPMLWSPYKLSKSGLERLDDRRFVITQSMYRQIKDQKHPLHYN